MATLFYDQIINDSDEMRKVYLSLFKRDSKVIAYEPALENQNPDLIKKVDFKTKRILLWL